MNALIPLRSTRRVASTPAASSLAPPSPGTWRHPNLTEIVSRRNASTFSDQDFKRAAFNFIALFLSFTFGAESHGLLHTLIQSLPYLQSQSHSTTTYVTYSILAVRLYLLLNLSLTLYPYFLPQANDTISDIPLTPSQRALMGLPPSPSPSKLTPTTSTPSPTPGSNTKSPTPTTPTYITPPRYRRTSFSHSPSPTGSAGTNNGLGPTTPSSGRSISANYSPSSPLSGRGAALTPDSTFRSLGTSTSMNRNAKSPFFSPTPRSSSGSPLLQKALASNNNRETDAAFRNSFSPSIPGSGLNRSQSVREDVGPRSPGSGGGSGSGSRSPALNYKWLYEKEKRGQMRGGAGILSRSESIQF